MECCCFAHKHPTAAMASPVSRVLHGAGYGLLGPFARSQGWAPGEIGDWRNGATGWILWVSLAIMLGDSLTSLSLLIVTAVEKELKRRRSGGGR